MYLFSHQHETPWNWGVTSLIPSPDASRLAPFRDVVNEVPTGALKRQMLVFSGTVENGLPKGTARGRGRGRCIFLQREHRETELGGTWRTTIGGFPIFVAFTKGRTSMNLGSKSQVRVRGLVRLREDGAAKIGKNSLGRCVGSGENQLTLSTRKVGTQSIQVLNSCLMTNSYQMWKAHWLPVTI